MKIKNLFLAALVLAFASAGFAQSKKAAAAAPDAVIKNLYAAHRANKSPFFQTKNRALIEQYFVKDLSDMIWKDAVDAKGEVGAIDFDPLYGSQEESTGLVIQKPREAGGPDYAFVKATFKTAGTAGWVDYELRREKGKWKIVGVYYNDGEDLASILRYSQDEEFRAEFDADKTFTGDYVIGKTKCSVMRTLNGMYHRVQCEGQEGFKLYAVEGNEIETAYINTNEKTKKESKFVFKNGAKSGKFIDAAGKEVKVTPVE